MKPENEIILEGFGRFCIRLMIVGIIYLLFIIYFILE